MSIDPMGGLPPTPPPPVSTPEPAPSIFGSLGSPTTLTTVIGALIAIGIGVTDAWAFHQLSYDQALIFGGLGALLGVNPLQRPA